MQVQSLAFGAAAARMLSTMQVQNLAFARSARLKKSIHDALHEIFTLPAVINSASARRTGSSRP
jgi:hypothetical protein